MDGPEILSVIIQRLGNNSGVTSINTELQSVLYDISSRADFLTAIDQIVTSDGVAGYDQPQGLKQVYECFITGSAPMEEKSYRDYLRFLAQSDATGGEPTNYARRHGKFYFWPVADGAYTINVDHAQYHPSTWTDVLFGAEFSEAIFEGVLAALYKGQLFEKLKLNGRQVKSRQLTEDETDSLDTTTTTDKEGTADDSTVTVDEDIVASVSTDDDTDVLTYQFDKDFPEIKKHVELYEAEIAKLIGNLTLESVVVEYRDI